MANQRTLVRFSLPAAPSYCTLTAAKLRLNASSGATGRTLEAYRAAAAWTVRDAAEGALLATSQVFSSREGANPPQLVLTFS